MWQIKGSQIAPFLQCEDVPLPCWCSLSLINVFHYHLKMMMSGNEEPQEKWKWEATERRERSHWEVSGRELGLGLQFHPFLGEQWIICIHPPWAMRTKLIILNIHPRILIFSPILFLLNGNGPYFIPIYLTCNGIIYFQWTLHYLEFFYNLYVKPDVKWI